MPRPNTEENIEKEKKMSEINLFNRWTVKKKHFWLAIGLGIPTLCVLTFIALALVGIPVGYGGGAAYNTVESDYGFSAPMEAPMVEEMAAEGEFYADDAVGGNSRSPLAGEVPADQMTASSNGAVVPERLIIREGNLTAVVEDTVATRERINDIVAELAGEGAYVVTASESGRGENRQPYISIVIRVPVGKFDTVMDQIAEMAVRVDERYENAQDVTDEYVDLEGRIDAMEVSIERLKELMRDADFTEDLLNAEEQLSRRESELEAYKGRLNYLAESAALSRINISLTPYELSQPIDTSWKPAETFRRAVEDLLRSLQDFADFMIYFGISFLPWLLFFGLIIWGVVVLVRRRRRNKAAKAGPQDE
jgi:hypothetical protein